MRRATAATSFALCLAASAVGMPAFGQAPRLFGQIDLGLAWLEDDAALYGRYSGLDENGLAPLLSFSLQHPGERPGDWRLRLDGARLGLDSRRLSVRADRAGRQSVSLTWRELPNWTLSGGRTPFSLDAAGRHVLPGDWQGLQTTAGLSESAAALNAVEIRSQRKRFDLGFRQRFRERWRVEVDASEERRDGNRLIGAIFGYSGGNPRGMLLPAVVDDRTQRIESRVTYSDPAGHQLGLAWYGSFYSNDRDAVTFDNAFAAHPQWAAGTGYPAGSGRLADYPDNAAHQLRAFGNWKLGERARLGADVAVGRMRQNDLLLPYTINPGLVVDQPLPVTRLDAEMHTRLANLRLVSPWTDRGSLVVNYRFDERDNRTPSLEWQIVGADSQNQRPPEETRINLPYSLRRQTLDFDSRWRLSGRQRLVAGLAFRREDRDDFAEVAQFDEWGAELGWRGRLGSFVRVRVDAERASRRFDEYRGKAPYRAGRLPASVDPDDFENHPELRKYNVADRDRSGLRLRLDAQPTARLSLGLNARYNRDDYDDARFGLERARVRSISADAGWQLAARVSLTGMISSDRYRADQSGRDWPGFAPELAFDPSRDWWASHDDRVETASLSLVWRDAAFARRAVALLGLDGRVDLGAEWVDVHARGNIEVSAADGLSVEPLPATSSRRRALAAWARMRLTGGWRMQLRLEHERYRARDFAHDGIEIDSVANLLLLGRRAPDYSLTAVLATLRYRF